MKKNIIFVFVILLASISLADTLTINYNAPNPVELDTLTFEIPVTVTCTGNCGGSFHAYFVHSDSLTELNKKENSCKSTGGASYSCTYTPTFKIFRWKYEPYVTIKAVSEGDFLPTGEMIDAITTLSDKIVINRKPGNLVGTIKKLTANEFEVKFECKDALCMGVYMSTNIGEEKFECGDMDKNSEPCVNKFTVNTANAAEIKGIATTVIPANQTFYTNTIKLSGGAEQQQTDNQQVDDATQPDAGTGSQTDNRTETSTEGKNIFQIIWEWILSLFGVKSYF